MSCEPPTPPQELPTGILETFDDFSPKLLRHVARYSKELAEYREREARLTENEENEVVEERSEDFPDDVPSKATITVKEINDNRYYYWQWREGEKIKSKYKGPVDSES
ncbi:hypothetical protein [Natronorubrum aibiense]|uniref:DUF6788 domain-containing protein n=1 Tax=Natronorubrum aibiense TaxID=348826 RepID=A0A5P9P8M1_9EURY|nr:hypothetical protein [Natronorubrum aibiense]QFU84230.1 hypothetical protein GCU68_16715 [Natronorubrum aibiense]